MADQYVNLKLLSEWEYPIITYHLSYGCLLYVYKYNSSHISLFLLKNVASGKPLIYIIRPNRKPFGWQVNLW